MFKVAICDDEKIIRESVKKCLDEYAFQRNVDVAYSEFSTGLDFLRDRSHYNILILDYQLGDDKDINGIAVAKRFRKVNQDTRIIFLTSFVKMVFSSFEVDTFRFLLKPLEPQKLFNALDDIRKLEEDDDSSVEIKMDGINTILNAKRILYLEGMGKYALIHTETQDIECREVLAEVEKRLPGNIFFRCHRSFIVNFKYISAYNSSKIILTNNKTIPISKKNLEGFKSAFILYTKRYSCL